MNEPSIISKLINFIGGLSASRVAILGLVITGAYYFLFFDNGEGLFQNIDTAKAALEAENIKKIETQKVLKKEQQMKGDVENNTKKFEEIKSKIPLEFLESELRMIVDRYSSQNNLKTTRSDRKQYSTRLSELNHPEENLIEQVSLDYTFEGTYLNISKFLTQITNLEKLIKIGDFTLTVNLARGVKNINSSDRIFHVQVIGFKQSLDVIKPIHKKVGP